MAQAGSADTATAKVGQELLRTSALDANAHLHLKHILAAPEFAQASHVPSAWDRWKLAFAQWLAQQLEQLFQAAAQHPTTSQIIFWAVAVAALIFIAFQLFRLWNRATVPTHPHAPEDHQSHPAVDWLAAARQAASLGDYNRAIQCAYWSAIASLQEQDALPKDSVQTPRELLTALRRNDAATPLRSLTGNMETFWYARRPASIGDWNACLHSLEALGCKQD